MNVSEFSRKGGLKGKARSAERGMRNAKAASPEGGTPNGRGVAEMDHVEFSRMGGEAGTGASKRRSPEHYRRLAKLGVAARRLRQFADRNGEGKVVMRSLTHI